MIEPYFEDADYNRYFQLYHNVLSDEVEVSAEYNTEELLDEDEIDAQEAGFLQGYDRL